MGGFLDGCKQSSDFLVPFMDTLVTGNIRYEEKLFLLSPRECSTISIKQTMTLCWHIKTKGITDKTISNLLDAQTPRCQEVRDSMDADSHDNIIISAKNNSKKVYNLTLNTKVTRGKPIQLYKRQLEKTRIDVINCMVDNIRDQVDSCILMFQFSAFDLKSKEDLNGRSQKISALYYTFGVDVEHAVKDKWNGFSMSITFKRKLNCSSEELQKDFEKVSPAINGMVRTLCFSHESLVPKSQMEL